MEVIHALQANLTAPGNGPVLHMMQHDGSRQIAVQLYAGTAVWAVPEGATAGIGYTLPDRQSSYYEILSDGTAACTIVGNTVTAVLAPVLTSIAGETKVSIILTKDGIQLSTFPFRIRVDARPGEVNPGAQPDAASPFIGKLYYGGDMGAPIPLGLGNGVRVVQTEDGSLLLIVAGSGNGSIAEETDPTVPEWAKQLQKPSYTAEEVGADAAGTASCLLGEHNGSRTSHWDVRMELQALSERLTAVLDSDDTTLDQLSEIVAYIKSNKSLIDAITTSKVSVADIVDNTVTNVSNKPLSAAMGVALASDIDSVRSSIEMMITGHNSNRNSHEDIRQYVQRNGDQIAALGRDKLDAAALPEALTEHNNSVGAHGALVLKVNRLVEDFRALADGYAVVAEAGIRDAGRKPVKAMISFMDDDCRKEVYHRKAETPNEPSLWELIQELGIPYTLACPPGNIYDPENPVEGNEEYLTVGELQEMHQGGVDISCHHWRQYNMDDTELLPTEDDYDADLTRCLEQFREWGITDVISVAYPQGVIADNYLHVAKRHFRMGFGVKKAINQRPYASFRMDRCETFPTGSAYVADLTLALAEAKARVDTLAQDGGWLICMTHAWYDTFSPGDLRSLVAYIREQGIEIVGVNEAIRTSGNVVEVGDIVKPLEEQTAPFFVVDADGNTHTNALHNYTPSGETLTEITPAYNLGYLSGGNGVRMTSDDTDRRITDDIPVQAGEVYRLTCSSIWSGAAYAVLTAASGGTVVDIVAGTADTPSTVLTDHEITIPDGGTILRVSCNLSVQPDGFRIRRVDNAGGGLTEEDKAELVDAVIAGLPKYAGEVS